VTPATRDRDADVVVVGSGFGGSVAALRLTEKGYRVLVLEAGRRFADDELPRTSWDARRFLWAPALGCYGIQRITLLGDALVLSGAGVGGGSLVYANTLYEPGTPFFADRQWAHLTDWQDELAPHYDTANRVLGVTRYPGTTPADEALHAVAAAMGRAGTLVRTPVGVFFGTPGEPAPDPYFGGAGPARTGCTSCGACMTGCRVGAKNTLPKNYLGLAEAAGARVSPLTTVTAVRPLTGGGWAVDTRRTGPGGGRQRRTVTADQVVLAAGTLGTQRLLHTMAWAGHLPDLSPRLGSLTRTNSEAVLGATAATTAVDYTAGVAITSSFHPDDTTHVEAVRYGPGSNAMGLIATILVDGDLPGGPHRARWRRFAAAAAADPAAFLRSLSVRRWSERTVIALVMQSRDNSLEVRGAPGPFGRVRLRTRQGHGEPNPTWIPAGNEAARLLARHIGGQPTGSWTELADVPVTAHILGGCVVGGTPDEGVVDAWQRVFGYPGLHVLDGAAVSANLGVNPSLTITAQAERAVAHWPNAGDPDPRPPVGAPYRRLPLVRPRRPAVPAAAPGALRW
jgi:cholesterol oxidase